MKQFLTSFVNFFPGVEDTPMPRLFPWPEVTNLAKEVRWTTPSRIEAAIIKTSSRQEMVSDIFQMTGDFLAVYSTVTIWKQDWPDIQLVKTSLFAVWSVDQAMVLIIDKVIYANPGTQGYAWCFDPRIRVIVCLN